MTMTDIQPRSDTTSHSDEIEQKIKELVALAGADPSSLEGDLIGQVIGASLKMIHDDIDLGQLKLMTRSFKEMRHAYRVFNEYRTGRCVSMFGSARTPSSHPDYLAAKGFGAAMAAEGWVCMTGAADGIMKAGLEDVDKGSSFGLSIRLPFENANQTILAGDPKLINFRYFFTRKLMFLSHSDALVAFPGGVGTQDELFEALTLMQTGKSNIVPIVLLGGENDTYWLEWEHYLQNHLLAKKFISAEDQNFYYRASNVQDAVDHVLQFYSRYHSSRYVKDLLVIRMHTPLTSQQIIDLNIEFRSLIQEGEIYMTSALSEEDDHLELPRIVFNHNRKHFGLLRLLIDRINQA